VSSRKQLGAVLREMTGRGFRPRQVEAPGRAWTGDLQCKTRTVRIEIQLTDWEFLEHPSIKVLSGIDPSKLLPHVGRDGGLCYFRTGDVVLDRHRPAVAIAQCLVQAQSVLEKLLFDPDFRRDDLQGEFETYWLQADANVSLVLLGTIGPKPARSPWRTTYWRLTKGTTVHRLLGDDTDEIGKLACSLQAERYENTSAPCWLFDTKVLPATPDAMPKTVKELFAWLKSWDRSLYLQIQHLLGSDREYLKYHAATLAVRSPVGWLGFGFDLNPTQARFAARKPKSYQQYLHKVGAATPLFRLCICEVSPAFVHSRNLTHPDLRDKHLTLVGCGAIGSYVAQSLVRLGAGTGKGRLRLIDPDMLLPENLGRHVLGYPALFENKASALTRELQGSFPLARIEAVTESAMGYEALFDAHLVIEATGDEAVATALNARHLDEAPTTPVLHAWILGNGEATQTIWVSGDKHACYRCLRIIDHDGQLQYRFPVLKEETERRQIGCHAFTPYAVSASLQAAGLVIEMVVDWLKFNNPTPRLRTRLAENANVFKVKNQNVDRLKECLACGRGLP
jgi:molybdopterin/thiamine biosynthesis adenylyltransferase